MRADPKASTRAGRDSAATSPSPVVGHAEALREHGADVVVQDLAELLE